VEEDWLQTVLLIRGATGRSPVFYVCDKDSKPCVSLLFFPLEADNRLTLVVLFPPRCSIKAENEQPVHLSIHGVYRNVVGRAFL
jgi:hypothetical protein